MDFLSFVKNEFFRPLVTLIIPGAIAFSTWAALILQRQPSIAEFAIKNDGLIISIFLAISLTVGLLLEDLGACVEIMCDKQLYKSRPDAKDRWEEYLKLEIKDELVGQRYLRTLLIRLKFELSILPAFLFSYLGLFCLNYSGNYWSSSALLGIGGILLILILYLSYEIWNSVVNLDDVRRLILESKNRASNGLP